MCLLPIFDGLATAGTDIGDYHGEAVALIPEVEDALAVLGLIIGRPANFGGRLGIAGRFVKFIKGVVGHKCNPLVLLIFSGSDSTANGGQLQTARAPA
jgi:hypothetical protein